MSRPVFSESSESRHGRVRKLPIRISPLHGESYASYVDRLAADINARISAVLYALGIVDEESDRAIGSGYGISLGEDRIELMATALELPTERVREMFLSHYDGRIIDLTGLDPSDRSSSRKVALREWAYFSGTHACPDCLRESGGAWQLRWKLPWSFACVKHRRLLADHCPECERRIGMARQDGSSRPRFISRIPVPGHCANAQKPGYAATGRAAYPCGYPLYEIATDILPNNGKLLGVQRKLDGAIHSEKVRSLGEEISSLDYFRELRSMVAFLLAVVEMEDVASVRAPSVKRAVREHIYERETIRRERADAGKGWRGASRQRLFVGAPDSAPLMAAVLPVAVGLLNSPSTSVLSASLGEYLERFRRLRSGSRSHLSNFGFSGRLDAALDEYMSRYSKTTTTLGMRPPKNGTSPEDGTARDFGGLTADNIPQLFWCEDYERDLAPLLIKSSPRYARRVCSMWAVKALMRCDWHEAAESLELPVEQTVGLKTRLLHNLNKDGNTQEFDRRLRAVLRRVGSDPDRVDYRKRREALEGFLFVPGDAWREMCAKAAVLPGKGGGKNRQAAAWLWAELTSSDHLLSPTYRDRDSENEREYFRRFLNRDLSSMLHDTLLEYGYGLLKTKKE